MAQMRLDKFLGEMGVGSRSQVKEMARKGRILVNGSPAGKADVKIDPEMDEIQADGKTVSYVSMEYYVLNKPAGVVSAREDGRYPTVLELIPQAKRKDLFPVGRLDLDTEGLLLITNDGQLAHRLLSPKKHVDKVYYARIAGRLPQDAVSRMAEGLALEEGWTTLPAVLEILEDGKGEKESQIHLTIREGKYHQVKRMFEALGCQVVYLKRLSMGPLVLDEGLLPGQCRPLTDEELRELNNA